MDAGRDGEKRFEMKQILSKPVVDTSKMVTNPRKNAKTQANKHTDTANTAVKAKSTTATKITKLVLKPKTMPKNAPATKMTTKKYSTKPVTIKSRSTLSTMISHESTFRVRNIKKSSANTKYGIKAAAISVKSEQISHQLTMNTNYFDTNQMLNVNNTFDMVHSEQNANITSMNLTKTMNSPILQEITSAVVNGSNIVSKISNDAHSLEKVVEYENRPPKSIVHCENGVNRQKKRFDVNRAQMQREKRKESQRSEKKNLKRPATKDEIKERLDALRKSTLNIVAKNVQKARNSSVQRSNSKNITSTKLNATPNKSAFSSKKSTEMIATESASVQQTNEVCTPQSHQISQSNKISSLVLTPSKFLPSIKSQKDRIGILRRTEKISPSLESAQTPIIPKINKTASSKSNNLGPSPARLNRNKAQTSFQYQSNQNSLELKIPETVPLTSSLMIEHGSSFEGQNKEDFAHNLKLNCETVMSKKEIPFWLRPTPVVPYPYNFIMAVRKKLESITHPVFSTGHPQPSYQSPVARPQTKFVSHFRRNLNTKTSESEPENIEPNEIDSVKVSNDTQHTDGLVEYTMEFPSDTMQSRLTESEVKSKSPHKSIRASQDTLSISSGILSHSSPEKRTKTSISNGTVAQNDDEQRQPSPLTTDNVDGLHITSNNLSHLEQIPNEIDKTTSHSVKSHRLSIQSNPASDRSMRSSVQNSSIASHINFHRGKDYDSNNQPNLQKLSKKQHVEDLLKDFTTSLSQAIEVNHRLHTILSNPPSNHDDFKNLATNNTQSVISEHITGSRNSTTFPSYKTNTVQSEAQHNTETQNNATNERDNIDISSNDKTSTENRINEDFSAIISTEKDILSSTRNENKSTYSMRLDGIQQNESRTEIEMSSHVEKASTTVIEEKINDSSESPTNNDLKSITLSIAKKSATTTDDTDQPTNAIESFKKQITGEPDVANKSIGSDIFNIFNKSSMRDEGNTSLWSEHNISYSTLGVCDQLLQSEMRKSQDLAALLKMREKTLIDRFKGQIAWLELQKQKLKANGLTTEISIIKKKQRALLLRLNNDRKELHRILKEHQQSKPVPSSSNVNFNISHTTTNMSIRRTSVSKQFNNAAAKQAIKAIELPGGGGAALEIMLQKRERELRHRREHVEKLLKWHQRLDIEEQEVLKMERMIMFISTSDVYQTTSHEQINDTVEITMHRHRKQTNLQPDEVSISHDQHSPTIDTITMEGKRFHQKKQKQIHHIEKSLNTLKIISSQSILSDADGSHMDNDVVEILGRQLNKLWTRLTGESEEKYVSDQKYTFRSSDMELLYEQAKSVVLKQFCTNEEFKRRLIDTTSIIDGSENNTNSTNSISHPATEINDSAKTEQEHEPTVPTLNLTSSSEPRENIISDSDPGYYFSNSIIESNIEQNDEQQQLQLNSTTKTMVETLVSEAATENLDNSQIRTEEQFEEDDDHSTSYQDEIQSDITEDSLNKPLQFINGNINSSEIQTVPETESHVNESDRSSQIPSAIENERLSEALTQEMNENSTQLIEETSFPEMDIQMTTSSVVEDISAPNLSLTEEQNYTSDNFEDKNNSEDVTTNCTTTVTKITTSTPPLTTTVSTATANQLSENNILEKSIEQSSTMRDEHPKELEQRLILIDDGLRDLSEAISQSPVLQSEPESSQHTNQIDDNKKSDSMSPVSESEEKSIPNEISRTASLEASENQSETEIVTESSNATTENEQSIENDESAKLESEESTDSIAAEIAASSTEHVALADTPATKRPFQYTLSGGSIDYNKVPEADALKRAPVSPETEQKMVDQGSSAIFPFLREIPNKPPPPYPVNRQLPKIPPFPSDDRIKEIVFNRIEELYEKPDSFQTPTRNDATFVKSPTLSISSSDSPSPPVQDEVNLFERIISDCCVEIMQEIFAPEKQPLRFFKPPNRLKCYQYFALNRIFKLINRPYSSHRSISDESKPFSLASQVAQLTYSNRRKRDQVDEILIQELYEDESRWTDFNLEEKEIMKNVPDLRTLLVIDDSAEIPETGVNVSNIE